MTDEQQTLTINVGRNPLTGTVWMNFGQVIGWLELTPEDAIIVGKTLLFQAGDKELERLKREVKVLRQFGNKDCTAMADEHLAAERKRKDD